MIDARNKLIELAEQALHSFVKMRLTDMGIEQSWKNGLSDFVNIEYEKNKAGFQTLYDFLQSNDEQGVMIEQLDITAIAALLYYDPKDPPKETDYRFQFRDIYRVNSETDRQLFYFHSKMIRNLRNTFDHYTQELTGIDKEKLCYDQLYYSACISNFAVLVMKYKKPSEEWKLIYHKAKAIESQLQGEHWLDINSMPNSVLDSDEDLSDLIALAEQGQVEAQVRLGKLYYYGERVKKDNDRAFIWFRKAAFAHNIEAKYYLHLCMNDNMFNQEQSEKLLKEASDNGYAPAQYEYVLRHGWASSTISEERKKELLGLVKSSAEQKYPNGILLLSECYSVGFGTERNSDEARRILVEAAGSGCDEACDCLGYEEEKKENYDAAIKWYSSINDRGKFEVERKLKRVERKKEKAKLKG